MASINNSVKPAILYMSISGNPTHLGHMAAVSTAIDVLEKENKIISQVYISLGSNRYLSGKVGRNGGTQLSNEARLYLLNGAIAEAAKRGMFRGIPVGYTPLEENSDHTPVYIELAKQNRDHDVYFVAGDDVCTRIGNWQYSIKHAIVLIGKAETFHQETLPEPKIEGWTRKFTHLNPDFAHYSSSAIQKGELQLEPQELQEYFEAALEKGK